MHRLGMVPWSNLRTRKVSAHALHETEETLKRGPSIDNPHQRHRHNVPENKYASPGRMGRPKATVEGTGTEGRRMRRSCLRSDVENHCCHVGTINATGTTTIYSHSTPSYAIWHPSLGRTR